MRICNRSLLALILVIIVGCPAALAATAPISFNFSETFTSSMDDTGVQVGVSYKTSLSGKLNLTGIPSNFNLGTPLYISAGDYSYSGLLGDAGAKFEPGKSETLTRLIPGGSETIKLKYSTKTLTVSIIRVSDKSASLGSSVLAEKFIDDGEDSVDAVLPVSVSLGGVVSHADIMITGKTPAIKVKKIKTGGTINSTSIKLAGKAADGTVALRGTSDLVTGVNVGGVTGTLNVSDFPDATSAGALSVTGSDQVVRGGSLSLQLLVDTAPDAIVTSILGLKGYYQIDYAGIATANAACAGCGRGATKYAAIAAARSVGARSGTIVNLVLDLSSDLDYSSLDVQVGLLTSGKVTQVAVHHATASTQAQASTKLQVTLAFAANAANVDLDLHVETPDGTDIYYGNRTSLDGGSLDQDCNAGCALDGKQNENITWTTHNPACGHYIVRVDLWSACSVVGPFNFTVTVNNNGVKTDYAGSFIETQADAGGAHSGTIIAEFDHDMILGQHIPEAREVDTVGNFTAKILHNSPEFNALVFNNNPNIAFDENGGTDNKHHYMTQKLSDKVDALAALVSAEWPGTMLNINAAYDFEDKHGVNSLHYEGRAADLATFPKDPAKYGRLGRLAVQAGFEWVFYENAAHVHASMSK